MVFQAPRAGKGQERTTTMTMEQLRQAPAPGLGLDPEDSGQLAPSNQGNAPEDDSMDALPDGDRQLTTDSTALDGGGAGESGDYTGGGNNDSDLGADVAGDIGPKHD